MQEGTSFASPRGFLRHHSTLRALRKRFCDRLLVALLVELYGSQLAAQAAPDTTACDGLLVDAIKVETTRPAFKGALGWWRKAAKAVGLHHQTTSPGLVRRFVTLDPGHMCTEFRRSESERILRSQPFLSDATVTTTRSGDSVLVNVATVDEVPVIVGARMGGTNVRALSLGTLNFLGAGMRVQAGWEDGVVNRDGFGGAFAHHQMFGHPYTLVVEGQRRPLGDFFIAGLQHPFYTDLQRIAWHSGFSTSEDFTLLRRTNRTQVLQPVDRSMWSVGGVVRFGPPHKLGLVGGMLLGERIVPRNEFFELDTLTGRHFVAVDTAGLRHYDVYDATSIGGVLGVRSIEYSRMRALDVLVAEQDVATGVQVTSMLGVNPWSDEPLGNLFGAMDAYAAKRGAQNLVAVRVEGESRIDLVTGDWQHLIVGGRAAWYARPGKYWVSELSVEAVGGWRTLLPFQIELGDRRTGLRGYGSSHEAGGQRMIARFEQRFDVARYQQTRAAFGVAGFVDAGNVWAGDVPFGVSTPMRVGVGTALLAAVPAQSKRTIRAEIAFPVVNAEGARYEVRFVILEPTPGFWSIPQRIRWARLSSVPEQIFNWP